MTFDKGGEEEVAERRMANFTASIKKWNCAQTHTTARWLDPLALIALHCLLSWHLIEIITTAIWPVTDEAEKMPLYLGSTLSFFLNLDIQQQQEGNCLNAVFNETNKQAGRENGMEHTAASEAADNKR